MSYQEIADGILAVPLYEPSICHAALDSIRLDAQWDSATIRLPSADGRFQSLPQKDIRAATILNEQQLAKAFPDFDFRMTTVIRPAIKEVWGADFTCHSGTQIVRYQAGGHYRAHVDAGQDMNDRYFSVVCYLNDDFEAGGTWFPNIAFRVVPECGKAIVFPSNYLHAAEPVRSGEKFVLVTWVVGPAPIKWI